MRRLSWLTGGLILVGLAVATGWVYFIGPARFFGALSRLKLPYVVVLAGITASSVFIRFVRWQYLLRRNGVRLPTRRSLSIYVASLAAIATPAYVGEVVRPVLVRRGFGVPLRLTLTILVAERLLDVAALGTVGLVSAQTSLARIAMAAVAAGPVVLALVLRKLSARAPNLGPILSSSTRPRVLGTAALLSLAAWLPASFLLPVAAASIGNPVGWVPGMNLFARATLLGGFSLMPAGVGVTGSVAIFGLQGIGASLPLAVSAVTILRLFTTGITLAVGGAFLARELRVTEDARPAEASGHFDAIARSYGDELPPHIRELLVERKTELIVSSLRSRGHGGGPAAVRGDPGDPAAVPDDPGGPAAVPDDLAGPGPGEGGAGRGLDLGCGPGYHCLAIGELDYRVVGMDPALSLVREARSAGATVVAGDGREMPFPDETFDFVYAIGVLHHLGAGASRKATCEEVRRILQPGGLFLLHETNPGNPLFRFYMGYVFPILRRIDEGTEQWIDPSSLELDGMRLLDLKYSTFLPDFTPRWLMKPLSRLERHLQASRWSHHGAHYLAVFEKTPSVTP